MKKVNKEEFDKILNKYPDRESHGVYFCTPSVVFYWKTKSNGDRSFGKDYFAKIVHSNPYFENSEEEYYINE